MFKALRWEDWVGFGIGAWLIASPWVMGFSDSNAATVSAFMTGSILVLLELMELEAHAALKESIDLITGLWLVVSPAVLGFESLGAASANAMLAGLLTMSFAAWAISPLDEMIGRWRHDHALRH